MDDLYSRSSLRERILNDLRNIVKQVYHESVNNELSPDNKIYICLTLIKNLDEVLRHGLKQLHFGYWKPVYKILHPDTRQSVENLQNTESVQCDSLLKGRAWIALTLKEDSFMSYVQCLVTESALHKYYEDWSILRTSDSCNKFLSILTGLDNVAFIFELEHLNKLPTECSFRVKNLTEVKELIPLNLGGSKSNTTSMTSLTSPVDSGVHIQDSALDMEHLLDDKQLNIDFLNGNISETVLLRKSKKNAKRHVSFHEDIIYKSPEKCRKLKWDSENLRYSWSGEQIDSSILKEVDFNEIKNQNKNSTPIKTLDISERGAPEGEETPSTSEYSKQNSKSQKSVIVQRFLQSIKKQTKMQHLYKKSNFGSNNNNNFKKINIDSNLVDEINNEIKRELDLKPKVVISKNEVFLNEFRIKDMIKNQSIYKSYKLRDFLFIITNANVYLISKDLKTKRIFFKNLNKVVVYPDFHAFLIYECNQEIHTFVTGDRELTGELLGRLEHSMRRNLFDPPIFIMLDYEDLALIKKVFIEKLAIGKREEVVYCGSVLVDKENDLLSSILPTNKRGFLMYRDVRAGDSWIPGYFHLKNGFLYLFEDNSSFPKLALNIASGCQSCSRTKNSDRPHTFQISLMEKEWETCLESYSSENNYTKSRHLKAETRRLFSGIRQKMNKLLMLGGSKNKGCVIEFAAANESELSEWLQVIIQASCGDFCEEAHKEELMEGTLWLTTKSLVITNEIYSADSEVEIISSAQLRDLTTFKIGDSKKDLFAVIEFLCMEASNTSGDWILYMNSREELENFKSTLLKLWKWNVKFPCEYIREGELIDHCRKFQKNASHYYWAQLLQ